MRPQVSWTKEAERLPRALVERALATCPREVLPAGATEADDVLLDGSAVHFVPSGTPNKRSTSRPTRGRRPAGAQDEGGPDETTR